MEDSSSFTCFISAGIQYHFLDIRNCSSKYHSIIIRYNYYVDIFIIRILLIVFIASVALVSLANVIIIFIILNIIIILILLLFECY